MVKGLRETFEKFWFKEEKAPGEVRKKRREEKRREEKRREKRREEKRRKEKKRKEKKKKEKKKKKKKKKKRIPERIRLILVHFPLIFFFFSDVEALL